MHQILRRAGAVVALGLATAPAAYAQRASQLAPAAAELKRKFARLSAGVEGESEAFIRLQNTAPDRLVAYLKTHELSAAGAKKLGLDLSAECKDAAHLKVFTYSYSSGGTRGTVHRPVLQWRNAAGQRFAYAPFEECEFTEIRRLASPGYPQYLLLGEDRGSGQCYLSQAYVVGLKGNYLLINKAAFAGSAQLSDNATDGASLIICNVAMEFNARRQVLNLVTPESADKPAVTRGILKWQGTHFVRAK
jgi:hypothetical protein